MTRIFGLAAFAAVCLALVAAPAFGAKGGGSGTATITFAKSGSTARTSGAVAAGSSVSFAVTANVKPADVYSLWVANICSKNGVTVSAEYHPVQSWTAGPFVTAGTSCTAYVWKFPDTATPLKGGSMTYAVS
jgi:hypothetical protein